MVHTQISYSSLRGGEIERLSGVARLLVGEGMQLQKLLSQVQFLLLHVVISVVVK